MEKSKKSEKFYLLEKEKIELERLRLEFESNFAKSQQELELRKFNFEVSKPWYMRNMPWLGPTTAALIGLAIVLTKQYYEDIEREQTNEREIEIQESKRKWEAIFKSTKGVGELEAKRNINFYIESGIIKDPDGKIKLSLEKFGAPTTKSLETDRSLRCDTNTKKDTSNSTGNLLIKDHILDDAIYCPTPKFSSGSLDQKFIIIHTTFSANIESTVDQLTNPSIKASAHIVIGRDGKVVQLLPFDRIAWHAGDSKWKNFSQLNRYSIGIELVNSGRLTKNTKTGNWITWYGKIIRNNEVDIINDEGWHTHTRAQIETLTRIISTLRAQYKINQDFILGHNQISPGKKVDPGPNFPWDAVRKTSSKR